ncbi:GntR family transcriptional regulator [Rhodococcus sp. HNM0569]|uniref:GntR family transcriptional regulator n=1 Tax=Rhodococcus sp. HNM0569 TaxID=2716340 RepID=UPI00146DDDCD|nr:GntR family transcriptional regulator [Rhodococcus sp. HNM0569]NLU82770.1 GntR family transcriptional regulator [Rhodococcus sp. HNM0569]
MPHRVETLSVVDALAGELRRRLFAGEITSHSPVTEAEVAGTYSVARPTAKAAIEKLVSEGLLQRSTHKTARVPRLGPDDVRDIYRTRASLESVVVRALSETRTVPQAALDANREISAMTDFDPIAVVEPDMAFHTALVDEMGSPRTSRMFRSLVGEIRLCMVQVQGHELLTVGGIATEHRMILDAIEAGDGDRAVDILTVHIGRSRERLVGLLGGTPRAEADVPEPA